MKQSYFLLFGHIKGCFQNGYNRGFTLVELIVIITILAILGTIGFISLQNSSSKSRDSNRIATIRTAVTGLSTKVVETGLYPLPDGQISTGSIQGVEVAYKGEFGDSVGRAIRYSYPLPKDPLTGVSLPYGVSFNKQYFQLAATLENTIRSYEYAPMLIENTYAATPVSAKVDGNYQGFMKFSSGSTRYLANMPSLIWFGNGTLDFTPPALSARFVRDGGSNVAYVFDATTTSTETPTQSVQALTKSTSAAFTGVSITGLNDSTALRNVFTGSTLSQFGGQIESVEVVVLGISTTSSGSGGGGGGSGSVVNGVCSTTAGVCTTGTPTGDTGATCGTTRNWSCTGSGGGSTASCSLANPICACPSGYYRATNGSCISGLFGPTPYQTAWNNCITDGAIMVDNNTIRGDTLPSTCVQSGNCGPLGTLPNGKMVWSSSTAIYNTTTYNNYYMSLCGTDGCAAHTGEHALASYPSGSVTSFATGADPTDGSHYYYCMKNAVGSAVNGTCGTANGKTYASGDTNYGTDTQCGLGNGIASVITFPVQGGSINWTCGGSNGGSASALCTANRTGVVINGVCGTAISQQHSTTTYSWEPGAFTVGGCSMPACNATQIGVTTPASTCGGGIIRTCTATNNSVQPSSNLCSSGTASAVSGAGPWTWTCAGSGGGASPTCSTLSPNFAGCTYAGQTFTQASTYPGCNTADKLVCTGNGFGYVWSMCNVGASTSGMSAASYGNMYQWGRNVGFSSAGGANIITGPLTATGAAATSDFITNSNAPYDWLITRNDNLWGAANSVSNTAVNNDTIFTKQSSGDMTLMRGPCAAGYHVPTAKEAFDTFAGINGGDFGAYAAITTLPQNTMQLPMAGYYYFSSATPIGQATMGVIWTASNSGGDARAMEWNGTYFYPYNTYGRALGIPVRCVKN